VKRLIPMSNRLVVALVVVLVVAVGAAGVALATPGTGVTNTPIAAGRLGPANLNIKTGDWKIDLRTKGVSDVSVVESRLAPGGSFGWHSHPGPSFSVVKSGTLSFYRADDPTCTPQIYHAGDVLIDPGHTVHIGRNEGSVDLVLVITRLVPAGAATRIDEPNPGNCPF
jgi:quercetin dioxygenase-like cupin family protein